MWDTDYNSYLHYVFDMNILLFQFKLSLDFWGDFFHMNIRVCTMLFFLPQFEPLSQTDLFLSMSSIFSL